MTLVVLGDEDPKWLPEEYVYEEAGVRRTLRFVAVKLLGLASRIEELEAHENPFGLFVVTHLTAQQTRGDVAARMERKLRLIRLLHERMTDAEELRQWFHYFDWFLDLPEEEDREVWRQIQLIEKEKQMPFITSVERIGYERGLEEGEEKGMEKGLRSAIELGLELRFGSEGLALMPQVRELTEPERLRKLMDVVKTAPTLDDVRQALARLTPPADRPPTLAPSTQPSASCRP